MYLILSHGTPTTILKMKTLQILVLLLFSIVAVEAQTVYITKTGSKYHTGTCRYLSRSKIPISLEAAMKRYGPCSVCKPPISVRKTQPSTSSTTTSASKTKVAYITSIVDGTDILEVNLWDHRTNRTTIVTSCRNNEKVTILEDDGSYVKLKTEDGKIGWCMKGFLKDNNLQIP